MRLIPRLSGLLIAGGPLALLLAVASLAAPARAITLPPPTGTLRVTYGAASVVAANPAIVITAADNRGNIDSWYQRYGTTTWTFQRVATASGGVSYGSPVVTWPAATSSSRLRTQAAAWTPGTSGPAAARAGPRTRSRPAATAPRRSPPAAPPPSC